MNAHDVIDLDGTLYHAVPYNVMCYQVGCPRGYTKEALKRLSSYPNDCVVGIECAHTDMKGTMTDATYKTLVEHSANLLKKFNLTTDDLWLHSEIVGKDYKDCHRWFTTTNPAAWPKFKSEVKALMNKTSATKASVSTGEIKKPASPAVNKPAPKPASNKLTFTKTLKPNDKSNDVRSLQLALNSLNFNCKGTDGVYGQNTKDAVKRFQSVYLPKEVDGIAGKNTIAKINSLL